VSRRGAWSDLLPGLNRRNGSTTVSSDARIRRQCGVSIFPNGCRIQKSSLKGLMQSLRLPSGRREGLALSPGRHSRLWLPIRLPLFQHPIGGLRQIARHGDDRFGVFLRLSNVLVELHHVALRSVLLVQHHRIGGFPIRPPQSCTAVRGGGVEYVSRSKRQAPSAASLIDWVSVCRGSPLAVCSIRAFHAPIAWLDPTGDVATSSLNCASV
jgi:hypothetical protein